VNCAIGLLQQQPAGFRPIILLLSQAEDDGSKTHAEAVLRGLAESGTTIYSLTFSQSPDSRRSSDTMSILADDIHNGYTLSFYPSSHESGLHTITVRVVKEGTRLKVASRTSYWFNGKTTE
jgi:hypothetical protein